MPIYEFYCDSCGHEFEKIVSFSVTQSPDCPSCAAQTVSRRMSRPAIHFKGSGWYITDSKKNNGNGSANGTSTNGSNAKTEGTSESPAKAEGSESTTTTKSESSSEKAAAKTDTKADTKASV
jgi:putative FmdB family regulatory protein